MNNINNSIPLPEDIWNIISYDFHVSRLQCLAVCSKELNCLFSRNQGLQLYNSMALCNSKLVRWTLKLESINDQSDVKATVETAIKILEHHFLYPKVMNFRDIVFLKSWISSSCMLIDDVTFKKFIYLDNAILNRYIENKYT